KGNVIPEFTKNDCIVIKKKSTTKQMVTWKKKKDLSSLKGRNIHVKFYVTDGELYSFWISPWQSGESRGYTSGGGPGLSPNGQDIKLTP
ncbi:MAG: hypothetical protein ABIN04_13350, partial [Ginsengibacter sp.]